jgi:hypothetical protein
MRTCGTCRHERLNASTVRGRPIRPITWSTAPRSVGRVAHLHRRELVTPDDGDHRAGATVDAELIATQQGDREAATDDGLRSGGDTEFTSASPARKLSPWPVPPGREHCHPTD